MATPGTDTDTPVRKVLVVGEFHTGKTSMLNALTGENRTVTSTEPVGTTFDCETTKRVRLDPDDNVYYEFVDTAGMGEGDGGRLKHIEAFRKLLDFITVHQEGFNLLILVVSANALTVTTEICYKTFVKSLFREYSSNKVQRQIEYLLVVTHMDKCRKEDGKLMTKEEWIAKNHCHLLKYGLDRPDEAIVPSVWFQGPYAEFENEAGFKKLVESSKSALIKAIRSRAHDKPVPLAYVRSNAYVFFAKLYNASISALFKTKKIKRANDRKSFKLGLEELGMNQEDAEVITSKVQMASELSANTNP